MTKKAKRKRLPRSTSKADDVGSARVSGVGAAKGLREPQASPKGKGLEEEDRRDGRATLPDTPVARSASDPATGKMERGRVVAYGAALLLVAACAAVAIGVPWSVVFADPGAPEVLGTDAYFHVRHASYTFQHFPAIARWDPAIYPHGAFTPYAGLFDVLIAGVAHLIPGVVARPEDIVKVAVFVPPALGMVAMLALFTLGRRISGTLGGAAAGVSLLLFPGSFLPRVLLGFVDHHALECALALLTIWGLEVCISEDKPWRKPAWLQALPLSLFLFSWFGAPLYVALVGLVFVLVTTLRVAFSSEVATIARAAVRYAAACTILTGPVALAWPDLVMAPKELKMAFLGFAVIALGVPCYAWVLARASARVPGYVAALFGLLVSGAALAVAANLPYGNGTIFSHTLAPKTTLVAEQHDVTWSFYAERGGAAAFIACLALPLLLRRARRGSFLGASALLLAGLVVGLWVQTHDYAYVAAPCLALLAGFSIAELWPTRTPRRLAYASIVAAALLVPIWPLKWVDRPIPSESFLRGLLSPNPPMREALRWMKETTPPLERPIDSRIAAEAKPDQPPGNYGVRAFWEHGHAIAWLTQRPVLIGGAISGFDAGWFLREDEAQADNVARYVIMDAPLGGKHFQVNLEILGRTLQDYITVAGESDLGGRRVRRWVYSERYSKTLTGRMIDLDGRGLSHYRMVYASPDRSLLFWEVLPDQSVWRRSVPVVGNPRVRRDEVRPSQQGLAHDTINVPNVRIYEYVRGATLDLPGSGARILEVALPLRAVRGDHTFVYRQRAFVGSDGRARITVPYPSDAPAPASDVVPRAKEYEVRPTDGTSLGTVTVSAADVAEGRTLRIESW